MLLASNRQKRWIKHGLNDQPECPDCNGNDTGRTKEISFYWCADCRSEFFVLFDGLFPCQRKFHYKQVVL